MTGSVTPRGQAAPLCGQPIPVQPSLGQATAASARQVELAGLVCLLRPSSRQQEMAPSTQPASPALGVSSALGVGEGLE